MNKPFDRYVSFAGSEWEARSQQMMALLQPHIDAADSPFWPYFMKQREIAYSNGMDDLRVLHNFLPTLKELLEQLDDHAALQALEALEVDCM